MDQIYNLTRTIQAAAVLLQETRACRMSYMRLLKLLYIADRELLAETGRSITGDHAIAMKYGPVLSRTYDMIKGESSRADQWETYIHRDGYEVELRGVPGRGKLSKGEIQKLREVTERYRHLCDFDLSELTHAFEEWQRNYDEKNPRHYIAWQQILEAQKKPEMIAAAEEDIRTRLALDQVLGTSP